MLARRAHDVHTHQGPHARGLGSVQGAAGGVQVEVPVHALGRRSHRTTQQRLGGDHRLAIHTGDALRARGAGGTRGAGGARGADGTNEAHGAHRTGGARRALGACGTRGTRRSCGPHGATGRSHQAHTHHARPATGAGFGSVEHIGNRIQIEVPHLTRGAGGHRGPGPVEHRAAIQARQARAPGGASGADGAHRAGGTRHTLGARGASEALGALDALPALQSRRARQAHGACRPRTGGLRSKDHVRRDVHVEVAIHAGARHGVRRARQCGLARDQDLPSRARRAFGAHGSSHALRSLRTRGAVHAVVACHTLGALDALHADGALGANDRHRARRPHAAALRSEQHVGGGVHVEVAVHADPHRGINGAR